MRGRHLCLIDPALVDLVGHPAEYDRAIIREVEEHQDGWAAHLLGSTTLAGDAVGDLHPDPCLRPFSQRFTGARRGNLILEPLLTSWDFHRVLRRRLGRVADQSWLLFMPTIDHRYLPAWSAWLRGFPRRRSPRVVLLFRFTYFDVGQDPPMRREGRAARWAFRSLAWAVRQGRVRLVTDSERLADEYRELSGLPFEVLPIPHTRPVATGQATAASRPLRFLLPGDARPEKGFELATAAIRRLGEVGAEGVEFILQCHVSTSDHAAMRDAAVAGLDPARVRLVDEVLGPEQYHGLMADSDVVLLPYSHRAYHARTSGPFTEAVASGKPVVVTDATWMRDQLEAGHGAGLTFANQDPDALAAAIIRTRDGYPELASRARASSVAFRDFHNPKTFLRLLVGPPA